MTSPDPPRSLRGHLQRVRRSPVAGRAGWTLADQAVSSAGNFALGLILARTLSRAEFGAFSLAFAAYLLILGASRALGSSVLQVRFTAVDPTAQRAAVRDATGLPVIVGLVVLVPMLLVAAVVRPLVGEALVALAVVLPGLLLQDAWRYALFSAGRARSAAANDAVWILVEFPLLGALIALDQISVTSAVLAWGGGAYVASIAGILQLGELPSLPGGTRWVRQHRDLGLPTLGEFLLLTGTWPALLFIAGGVAGLEDAGALRAAEILLGPFNILFTGAVLLAVPEGARVYAVEPARLPRMLELGGLACAALALVAGAVWFLVPRGVGEAVVGPNWDAARPVVAPLSLHFAAAALMVSWMAGLRILEAAHDALVIRVALTPMYLVSASFGLLVGGPVGLALGTAAVSVGGAAVIRRAFRRCFSARLAAGPPLGVHVSQPSGWERP